MSFINVESGGYQFRVILGRHDIPASSSQLSPGCTGIVIEQNVSNANLAYDVLKGTGIYANYPKLRMLRSIREAAMQKSIPVAMAEPYITADMFDYLQTVLSGRGVGKFVTPIFPNPFKALSNTSLIFKVSSNSEEIIIGDATHKKLKEIEKQSALSVKLLVTQRNHLMAERSYAFARYQAQKGVGVPSIDIVTGTLHSGIVESLILSPEDRARDILESPELSRYYQANTLGEVLSATYDPHKRQWSKKSFADPLLKGK